MQKAFEIQNKAFLERLESMQGELNLVISQKDDLECEISSSALERNLLARYLNKTLLC